MVTVVWDTWLKPGAEAEGLRLTRQVCSDMRRFEVSGQMTLKLNRVAVNSASAVA